MSGEVRHFSDGCTAGHAASVQPFHLGSLSRSDLRGAWSRAVASSSTRAGCGSSIYCRTTFSVVKAAHGPAVARFFFLFQVVPPFSVQHLFAATFRA